MYHYTGSVVVECADNVVGDVWALNVTTVLGEDGGNLKTGNVGGSRYWWR